ncbi:MAG: ATP-binding cassette domain-containing protein [Kiritimatiellae bacterium]|nr:ATP-binding cassette domain-containing protein [Kiritimatiellia bacterium]
MISLAAEHITVTFKRRGAGRFKALDDVSLAIAPGAAVGLIGESGSGKSTLVRVLMGLQQPDSGRLLLDGSELNMRDARRQMRRQVQLIFQDAAGALNPRQTVFAALSEVLKVHGLQRTGRAALAAQIAELLARVGLPESLVRQYPRELSGGQCQRVCIARALAVQPAVLIADEPVSALDVSVQARILRLLAELRRSTGLSLLLVAHDLAVVKAVCEHAVVLQAGRVVEQGPPARLFTAPQHPYTRRLLAAVPRLPVEAMDR